MIIGIPRVLCERGGPIRLSGLLDGGSVKLSTGRDAELDAVRLEGGFVWERSSDNAGK